MGRIYLSDLVNLKSEELPEEFDKSNVIYKITNLITGYSYIGQTISFKSRFYHWNGYVSAINKWITSGFDGKLNKLFEAFRLFGIKNFEVSILEFDINPSDLSNKEIQYISSYNTYLGEGYNMTKGGETHQYVRKSLDFEESIICNKVESSDRYIKSKISYLILLEMCENLKAGGFELFTGDLYTYYGVPGFHRYDKREMKRNFANFREFGFDIELISSCIRSDWQ